MLQQRAYGTCQIKLLCSTKQCDLPYTDIQTVWDYEAGHDENGNSILDPVINSRAIDALKRCDHVFGFDVGPSTAEVHQLPKLHELKTTTSYYAQLRFPDGREVKAHVFVGEIKGYDQGVSMLVTMPCEEEE